MAIDQPAPLSVPTNGTLSRLQSTTFPHPHARSVTDDVVSAVTRPGGPRIVALIGPAGVGKSKQLAIIENVLSHHYRAELEASPQCMPVIRMEAPAAMRADYPLGLFFKAALRALHDPELDRLVGVTQLVTPSRAERIQPARVTWEDLRDIAERRFRKRGVRVAAIDEANHMARHRHPEDLLATLDVVKAFAQAADIRIILCGAPGLREFERASAQLGRRIIPFEFHRYRWTVAHERKAFRKVARAMLECIDGLDDHLIEESLDQCFERSLGCVGTLRDWLVQAEHEFVTSGHPWSACLARPAPSTEKAMASLDEIEDFETRPEPATRGELRLRLGLTSNDAPPNRGNRPTDKPSVRGLRVGRRSPVRDPRRSEEARHG